MDSNDYYADGDGGGLDTQVPSTLTLTTTGDVLESAIIEGEVEDPYLLCANDSVNYTASSIFCNWSYSFPNYEQNVRLLFNSARF